MAADTRPPARTAAKNESAPPRVQSAPPISANAPKRCTAPAVPGKYSKRPSEPFRKVFYIPLSLIILFSTPSGSHAAVMSSHYLAARRALRDIVLTRFAFRSSVRAATRSLKKPFIIICHAPLCDIVETVSRSLLLSYTERQLKTSGSFYEYCIINMRYVCA